MNIDWEILVFFSTDPPPPGEYCEYDQSREH